jgi:hypothetical protein
VLMEDIQEIPKFTNDEEFGYFEKTVDKPRVVKAGYWKTRRGAALVQKAEHIDRTHKGNKIPQFGMIES